MDQSKGRFELVATKWGKLYEIWGVVVGVRPGGTRSHRRGVADDQCSKRAGCPGQSRQVAPVGVELNDGISG